MRVVRGVGDGRAWAETFVVVDVLLSHKLVRGVHHCNSFVFSVIAVRLVASAPLLPFSLLGQDIGSCAQTRIVEV